MQRVRMSLPYFADFGWEAEVVTVDEQHSDMLKDDLLMESLPENTKIHTVKALPKNLTSKFGLGSLIIRSFWFYKKKVNQLLMTKHFDLIYFSTTQYPVCILGPYWKKRFGVPYVIDMQDPWHSEYYQDKPKNQRPKKYWFSYRFNKYLEPIAMKQVGGLISVSESYIDNLKSYYPEIAAIPSSVITFGYFEQDISIAIENQNMFRCLLSPGFKNIVYVGRGGIDMQKAIRPVFNSLKQFTLSYPEAGNKIKMYFIGTSYAPAGTGKLTIQPLAEEIGIQDNVIEITDRISYYHALVTLHQADALFMPGSDDPKYTASKIYPYLLVKKPLLAIFNSLSPALEVLRSCGVEHAYSYDLSGNLANQLSNFLSAVSNDSFKLPEYNNAQLTQYSAKSTTQKQCDLFNQVVKA